jgi:hypothetical protein
MGVEVEGETLGDDPSGAKGGLAEVRRRQKIREDQEV